MTKDFSAGQDQLHVILGDDWGPEGKEKGPRVSQGEKEEEKEKKEKKVQIN